MKPLLASVCLLALAACTQQPRASHADVCQSYGYQPGTALFLDCIGQRQQAAIAAVGMWQAGVAQTQAATMAPMLSVLSNPPTIGDYSRSGVICNRTGPYTYCN